MRRPAVLRVGVSMSPMNVSFEAPPVRGVCLRRQATERIERPRVRQVASHPEIVKEVVVSSSPHEEALASLPEPRLVRSPHDDGICIVFRDLATDDEDLLGSRRIEEAIAASMQTVPKPERKPRSPKVPRESREMAAYVRTHGLTVSYDALGQYVLHMLGHHHAFRAYVHSTVHRLPAYGNPRISDQELFQQALDKLRADLIKIMCATGRWLPEQTRQGYSACRFHYQNRAFIALVDRSKQGSGEVVGICTSAHFGQSRVGRTSPRKTLAQAAKRHTHRGHWRSWE